MSKLTHAMTIMALIVSLIASAQAGAQHAHVHGLASLSIANQGDVLEILFESPAGDIVGFEHRAKAAVEKEAVDAATLILRSPQQLFEFMGSGCQLISAKVDMSEVIDNESDGHRHKHHDHDHNHDSHSEVSAAYQFKCNQLDGLSTSLLEYFDSLTKINAVWVTDEQQGAAELTSANNTVLLK